MSVDPQRLSRFVEDIEASLERLRPLGAMPVSEFLADEDAQDIARSRLLTAIEAALSICFHVSAHRLKKVPTEYAQCFQLLKEAGLLEPDLAARLVLMARFRNRLIHVCWETDYAEVHRIVRENLGDLRSFVAAVSDVG